MPSISAAAAHSAHFIDTEAQTTQVTSSGSRSKKEGYLRRAVFAACALGIAGGLAQAFRTQNPQPYYPANRQLQNRNETANTIPERQAEPGSNTTAPSPTPEPTLEPCPEGQYRNDQNNKNKQMKKLKKILAASGGLTLTGIALACVPLNRGVFHRKPCKSLVNWSSAVLSAGGGCVFTLVGIYTIVSAETKPDDLCHDLARHHGSSCC